MDRMPNDGGIAALAPGSGKGRRAGSRRILGIDFFSGGAVEAVERMRDGGLLVVPAAPALSNLPRNTKYREALLQADMAIADSAFMVMVWNLLQRDNLGRLSGLEYFLELVKDEDFRSASTTLYIMASEESRERNIAWLLRQGIQVGAEQVYVAPYYEDKIADPELLERVFALRPRHIVITLGGGVQECLGLYIKQAVDYAPSIHCIGAAIAFRSGDQVYIPNVADRLALTWLVRCIWRPKTYVPRYWAARQLAWLLYRYRAELPPVVNADSAVRPGSSTSVA